MFSAEIRNYFRGRKCLRKKVLRFWRFWLKSQKFIPTKYSKISELQKIIPAKYSKISEPQKIFPQNIHIYPNRKSIFCKNENNPQLRY